VLSALKEFPDGLTMGQLAAKLMVSKGNITGVVRRLQEHQYVRQTKSRQDRRIQLVRLTAKGHELWAEMNEEYRRVIEAGVDLGEGLEDRITLLKSDYRDLEGSYDKLVSVEMFEAVGHRYHATFFRKCCDLLTPEGLMVLQTITIADQRYEAAKRSVDFIQRYIFPGGCLPSVTSMNRTMTEHTDFRLTHAEDIGPHYATTLRHWHDRLFERIDEVQF